ncbi:AMP-binding protein [Streptomyces sp. NPDC056821]|uniref:AMP-binding protein n=1 Tax=unclassified Streptomyces TaxID=2593676 RepID=UPI0036AB3A8C
MGKSVDLVVALLGIWRRGAVHVPLFTAFGPPAIAMRLEASAAKVRFPGGLRGGTALRPTPRGGRGFHRH